MITAKKYAERRETIGTQQEVARMLGVSRVTLARRETGAREVSREAWIALCTLPTKAAAVAAKTEKKAGAKKSRR
jgi:DNA-binding XRE family transcriptional regulator